ncbi:hypothetical protein JIN84_08575 [Luteolibacter yonseiensis]|uniref:Uncharacterized protein n=1 Tax=Luteolibacter yonseiensis TaxID=1144680 RepID=A0A934R423_9BACT|nr:hypothetical protein [Luteolibacter yonseiensis]MBK1815668.1 hypothetical protein [Luteolibacter yonseiensis]
MAGIWGDVPTIDPASIVWTPASHPYLYRVGTAIDQRTNTPIDVHEGSGGKIYWESTALYSDQWAANPTFAQTFGAINDWGEFAGLYAGNMDLGVFSSEGYQTSLTQTSDNGIFFYEGSYHVSKSRPSIYGVSNDPRILIGTPYAIWSGSQVVPVANLIPAGTSAMMTSIRLADHGHIVIQTSPAYAVPIHILKPNQDADNDGMPDDWEKYYGFNPDDASDALIDSDEDGTINLAEFKFRTNPQLVPIPNTAQFIDIRPGIDTDGDGMPNVWEWKHGLAYDNPSDVDLDADRDGLLNLHEFLLGTAMDMADSDADGVSDGEEVMVLFTDPFSSNDLDNDGMYDDWEKHFTNMLLSMGAPTSHWGPNLPKLQSGDVDPADTFEADGVNALDTFKKDSNAGADTARPSHYMQVMRSQVTVYGNYTEYKPEEGEPYHSLDSGGSAIFSNATANNVGSASTWSRSQYTTENLTATGSTLSPLPTLAYVKQKAGGLPWTKFTLWDDTTENSLFPMEPGHWPNDMAAGGSASYYNFKKTFEDSDDTDEDWQGGVNKTKFRIQRSRPSPEPETHYFIKCTSEEDWIDLEEIPVVAPALDPTSKTTEIEIVECVIPAYSQVSPWIETTPEIKAQKYRSVRIFPFQIAGWDREETPQSAPGGTVVIGSPPGGNPPPPTPDPLPGNTGGYHWTNNEPRKLRQIKISKMENSLSEQAALEPDLDADGFIFRAMGCDKQITLTLETRDSQNQVVDPGGEEIKTALNGSGTALVTQSMVLVADIEDDAQSISTVGMDEKLLVTGDPSRPFVSDRTHRAKLGGQVLITSIKYDGVPAAMTNPISIPVMAHRKEVHLNIHILADAGDFATIKAHAEAEVEATKERFAQVGVKIEANYVPSPVPTPAQGPTLGPEGTDILVFDNGTITQDMSIMLNSLGTPNNTDDYQVFYCKNLSIAKDDNHPTGVMAGIAVIREDLNYQKNMFINADSFMVYTLAHELGHVLTKSGHYRQAYALNAELYQRDHNLMTPQPPNNSRDISAEKRLTQEQKNLIFPAKK